MVRTARCIVPVLVAAVLAVAVPSGGILAQEKKAPPKAQPKKKNTVELELTGGTIQLDGLKLEGLKGRLTIKDPVRPVKLRAQEIVVVLQDRVRLVAPRIRLGRQMFRIDGRGMLLTENSNPIMKGDYLEALGELKKKRAKLDGIKNPKDARRVIDEMQRILLDARKALWELEQAEKKKAPAKNASVEKAPAKKAIK